mmetsp:Transcript_42759/g.103890  ORF Transcript_42759/g.103890 Transcript_42759/m.103890 type:complete len:81 (-) Transcript_42759:66-308(-)
MPCCVSCICRGCLVLDREQLESDHSSSFLCANATAFLKYWKWQRITVLLSRSRNKDGAPFWDNVHVHTLCEEPGISRLSV